jgi:hypothetical protein
VFLWYDFIEKLKSDKFNNTIKTGKAYK